ncbi:MAG: 16S rRNA (cytosine(967)-C(5))-methyltransferase RsmB [Steroidobacteraceae bacterium]
MNRPENPAASTLADAARAVAAVLTGQSADTALAAFEASARRAAVRAIALGTMRWYLRLQPAVDGLLARPHALGRDVHALLVTAAHQIEYSRNAPQQIVHAAVDAARILRHAHASGLVNAVLRKLVAQREVLFARVDEDPARRSAHPRWLVALLQAAWPQQSEAILAANNAHPPLTLRLNPQLRPAQQYLQDLACAGLSGRPLDGIAGAAGPTAISVEPPVPVTALPGFSAGWVSVQDAAGQLAAPLLDALPGMRVLDACAAPGSKTAHILERNGALELWALDIDPARLERVAETLSRLKLSAHLVAADVRRPESFWDGRPFGRILVDAPCSGTGVIRRHPDIKLLRRAEDIAQLVATQLEILGAAFRLLAPGGRLLYSTCSVLPAENEGVVARLLAAEPQARPVALPAAQLPAGAVLCPYGAQLLAGGAADTDGFYYACIEKTTPAS